MKKTLIYFLACLLLSTFSNAQTVFSESFDATTTPAAWSNTAVSGGLWFFSTGADYDVAATLDHTGNSGNYAWVDFSGTDDSVILTTPTINVSTLTTPFLEFYHESHYTGTLVPFNLLHVEAWNGATWVNVTTLQGNTPFGWDQYGFDMSTFTFGGGDSLKVRFHAESGGNTSDFNNDLLIDDIAVMEQPTCLNPNTLGATNITALDADLTWVEPGTATSWEIQFGLQGFALGTGTTTVTGAQPFNITGLAGNTDYAFYVRSICGPGDTSNITGPYTFTTPCSVFSPNYLENFATYLDPCWSEAEGVLSTSTVLTGTSSFWVADGFGNVGTTGAAKINLYATGRDEWLISPSIDLGAGATSYQLEFDIALTDFANTNVGPLGVDDTFAVVISTDNGATWELANTLQAWLQGSEPSNTGDHITLSLAGYTGVVKFGFYAASSVSNEDNDIFIDNFFVTTLTNCASTSLLANSNIAANTVDLVWTENGTATSWIVEYGTSGFTPGTGTAVTAGTNPFTLTGLMPTTSYDIYVRALCAAGDTSSYGSLINILTLATCPAPTALTANSPTSTITDLGWTEIGSATNWEVEYGLTGFAQGTGTNSVTSSNPFTITGLTAITTYQFYVRAICGPADSSLWVGPFNFTTPCAAEIAPWLDDIEAHTATTNLGNSNCWSTSSASAFDWNIDGSASTPSTGTGPTGAFSGNNYFYVEASGGSVGNVAELVSPLVDITPLTTPFLEFYYHMFGDQRGVMSDLYIDIYDGATWTVVDSIIGEQQAAQADPWLKRIINLSAFSGTVQVRFRAFKNGAQWGDISLDDIAIQEAPTCPQPTNLAITNITATTADLGWVENGAATNWQIEWGAAGFAQGSGTNLFISNNPNSTTGLTPNSSLAFYVRSICGAGDTSLWTGPVTFVTPPTCPQPTNLAVTNLMPTTADLGWTEAGAATAWEIEYGTTGFAQGSGTAVITTSNPENITGLTDNTAYQFYVRAVCGPADSSFWSGPFTFNTPCLPVMTPWFDDIEAHTATTNLGNSNCWSTSSASAFDWNIDGSASTPSTGTGPTGAFSGNNYFYVEASSGANGDVAELVSPFVDMTALVAPRLEFYYHMFGDQRGVMSDLYVDIYDGATWTLVDSIIGEQQAAQADPWLEKTVDLSAFSGTVQVRFRAIKNGAQWGDISLDDIAIRETPIPNLVITEIMYNPPESGTDSLEFVEIYNNGAIAADLTNYTLTGITYTFPAVTLPAGGYYVIGVNASAFNTVYGFAADGIASSGGLSNSGEALIIRTPMGVVVDSVDYGDGNPWPSGSGAGLPDGGGSSIILCDTTSDNADGNNWNACVTSTGVMINGNLVLASPGAANACPAPLDVSVAAFLNLDSIYCNAGMISGSVIITNMSATDATNVPYTITASGTPLGAGTIALLAGNASDTITVGPFPAATGVANIVAITSLTGDVDAANDTLSMMVYVSNTTATASVTTAIACNGDSTGAVMVVGADGIGAYTYMWNADANLATDSLMNLPAGMNTVVIMDSVGCTDTAMVTLTEPTAIVLTASTTNVLCNGDSTGMAMVMATGGTPAYSYAWSNGATTDMNMNLTAGSYVVTVTDANGCMEMITSTIAEPTALDVTITDNGDGSAYATATGGTAGYSFLWDAAAGNQTTDTATALINNGAYVVTVTDANGCTDTASVVIIINGVNSIANLSNLNLFPNPTNANVFVELELVNNADVQINITNSIGQLVISKELTNVQSEKVELNTSTLTSGVYMVQFTIGSTELITRKLIVSKQ